MRRLLVRLISNSIHKVFIIFGCAGVRRRMEFGVFRRRLGEANHKDDMKNSHVGDMEVESDKENQFKKSCYKKRCLVVVFLVMMIIGANYIGIGSILRFIGVSSNLALGNSVTKGRLVTTGAVAADSPECSQIGRDILLRHGSAVDSAIATLLCSHNTHPHSSGIGGGATMVIYDPKENKTVAINGKVVAPSKGTHDTVRSKFLSVGPLSIGIPGEIRGYWEAHQRYGKLPWKELFAPSIAMLEKGVGMTEDGVKSLKYIQYKQSLPKYNQTLEEYFPDLRNIFCHENGEVRQEGEVIHRLTYLQTLRKIAKHGADYLYSGNGAKLLISDLQKEGSILTREDLKNYQPLIIETIKEEIADGLVLHTAGDHGGGLLLVFILKILKGYNITRESFSVENEVKTYHLLTEIFKFSSAINYAIGDARFIKDMDKKIKYFYSEEFIRSVRNFIDHTKTQSDELYEKFVNGSNGTGVEKGTSHVSVLGPDGDAVSITSTINHYYGSLVYSKSTGIILNNGMNSFFSNGQPYNQIESGKMATGGSAPSLFFKNGDIALVIGSSGGDRIAASIATVVMGLFSLNKTLAEAIKTKRYFYDIRKLMLVHEADFPEHILNQLKDDYGHPLLPRTNLISAVQAIYKDPTTGKIIAHSDERKQGKACLVKQIVLSDNIL
ncbi:scoloptoxin SSD14 [Patella vulgata]|uniref:scoloptoxin SSD14 n=1 Tax=Patella vulgata TaxID=6465 RepID=UPI00218037C5|nr:scoloptoxin SSD14 [Patella vulgata]